MGIYKLNMNFTKQEILDKAKYIIDELCNYGSYSIGHISFNESEHIHKGSYKEQQLSVWTIAIDINSAIFGDTSDFLLINDINCEPIYYQTKHTVYEVEKVDGKYTFKDMS